MSLTSMLVAIPAIPVWNFKLVAKATPFGRNMVVSLKKLCPRRNRQIYFAVKGYKKRLTSLFRRLSIACLLIFYVLKSGGFCINTRPR